MDGTNLSTCTLELGPGECTGCRLGRCKPVPFSKQAAPSKGLPLLASIRSPRIPSTVGYEFFGQGVDTDMCTSMPQSFPHGFTIFTNFCDRCTAELFLYFQRGPNSQEVASALEDFENRTKHRLHEGKVWQWSTDNDLAFEGPEVKKVADRLIDLHTRSASGTTEKNAHPVSERSIGIVRQSVLAMRFYPQHYDFHAAPECLWPWAAHQTELLLYFLSTEAHNPATSPYRFAYPDGEAADLSWAWPMFCDVSVRLQEADMEGKMSARGCDGCHLGYDWRRGCHFVFLPSINRLGSYTVTNWRPESFIQCQGITFDTPVNYRGDGGDLQMSTETQSRVPSRRRATMRASSAKASIETDAILIENARRISEGVKELEKEGVEAFEEDAVAAMADETPDAERALLTGIDNVWADKNATVEVRLHAPTERARKAAEASGITAIKTVDEAMASQWWPLFQERMEEEINGKLANQAFVCVQRPTGHPVMKSKWVFDVKLNADGSIKKVKTRFVGCGYSQIEGRDYDSVYAATPPAYSLRFWFTVVTDEGLDTDHIDAVKAFTQAEVDRKLYCEMPDGFLKEGWVLLLLKALEGIKQGAYLWFKKNQWAWGKCGLTSKISDPNLYTHPTLQIITAVFADDCGVGYHPTIRSEYLALRKEYGKLINIDSPGPDMTVPVTMFTGLDVDRDWDAGTISISQKTYIRKLAKKYGNLVTMNEMPTPTSKAKRDAFEMMEKGTEETCYKQPEYLEGLGEIGWCAAMTVPELAYYHSKLGSHMQYPTRAAHEAMMYVMGYLINNEHNPITYGGKPKTPPGITEPIDYFEESRGMYVIHDASWGKTPRPQAGHAVFRSNAAMHWSSKGLKVVTDSTSEAETAEASRATKSVMFGRMIAEDTGRPVLGPTAAVGDNSASYLLIQKEGTSQRTRYFERATMLVKYAIMQFIVKPFLVKTNLMTADVFTKAVDEDMFFYCKHMLHNTTRQSYVTRKASRLATALVRTMGR